MSELADAMHVKGIVSEKGSRGSGSFLLSFGNKSSCSVERHGFLANEGEVKQPCHIPRGVWPAWLRHGAMRPHLILEGKIFEACQ